VYQKVHTHSPKNTQKTNGTECKCKQYIFFLQYKKFFTIEKKINVNGDLLAQMPYITYNISMCVM